MDMILVRHGQSADASPSGGDAERPLTAEGRKSFTAAAQGVARILNPPARWITSPLLRARETAAILEQAMGFEGELLTSEALVPDASPAEILAELARSTDDTVVIGHEPHMGALLGLLITGRQNVSIPFKKGMIAGVRLDHASALPGRLFLVLSCIRFRFSGCVSFGGAGFLCLVGAWDLFGFFGNRGAWLLFNSRFLRVRLRSFVGRRRWRRGGGGFRRRGCRR